MEIKTLIDTLLSPKYLHKTLIYSFLLLSYLTYFVVKDAGFWGDWLGWQAEYEAKGFAGIPSSFGYKGLQPVLQFFNFGLFRTFGTDGFGWYLIFATAHGFCAYMLYRVFDRLLYPESPDVFRLPLWVGAMLFLLSPYATEVLILKVCLHYLITTTVALLCLDRLLMLLQDPHAVYSLRNKYVWQMHILLILGILSLELGLVIPGMCGLLIIMHQMARRQFDKGPWLAIIGVQFLILVGYFVTNRLVLGAWVGHYGAGTHLKLSPLDLWGNFMKYMVKQLFFVRHWDHQYKEAFFNMFNLTSVRIGSAILLLGVPLAVFFTQKTIKKETRTAMFALFCFFLAVFPVANLYFVILLLGENDRYGYMASGFLWVAVCLLLYHALPRKVHVFLYGVLLVVSLGLLAKTLSVYHHAEKIFYSLLYDFRWYDKENVLVLVNVDNYCGPWVNRAVGAESALDEGLKYVRKKPFKGNIQDVVQYNMASPKDSIKVETDPNGVIYLGFGQTDNWFWNSGIGATSYENDWYTFTRKEWNAELRLKTQKPNTVMIYPKGGKWHEYVSKKE